MATLSALALACVFATPQPENSQTSPTIQYPSQVTLEAIKSQVNHEHSGVQELVTEHKLLPVSEGDRVNVDTGGLAMLNLTDILSVRIFKDSKLKLQLQGIVNPTASAADAIIKLDAGAAFGTLNEQAHRQLAVETDWATVNIVGTEFWVYYDLATQITWVVVMKGKVDVTDKVTRTTVRVQEKFQTWVKPGSPPEPPIPASRPVVGGQFPLVEDLTNGDKRDGWLLDNPQCTVKVASVGLRQTLDVQSTVVDTLPQNMRFEAIGRSADGTVLIGRSAANILGWVDATAVTCAYDPLQLPVSQPSVTPVTPVAPITPTVAPVTPVAPVAFAVSSATANVAPQASTTCPATFAFAAQIAASAPGFAEYVWESSDGWSSTQVVEFKEPGTQTVSINRTLDQAFAGWVQLRVTKPNGLASNQVNYSLTCAPIGPPPGTVTQVQVSSRTPNIRAVCPATVNFVASLTAAAPGTVTYRWQADDGFTSNVLSLNFKQAGALRVQFARSFQASAQGAMRLIVLTPNELASNDLAYSVDCETPTVTPVSLPPTVIPSVGFIADATTITAGQCTTLHWRTSNVAGVFLDGKGITSPGELQVCPRETTIYSLQVQFNGGGSQVYPVTIIVNPPQERPSARFWVEPEKIALVQCAVLHWTTTNVKSVFLGREGVPSPGERQVCPKDTTTYTLRVAFNDGTSADYQATVSVAQSFDLNSFAGSWRNADPNTRSWTRAEITIKGNNVVMHLWGSCTPRECDAGDAIGQWDGNALRMTLNSGFATRTFIANLSGETLQLSTLTHFTDNSGRKDYGSTDSFRKEPRIG